MTYGLLTPDVPLGPFEGARITVWSAPGKRAKLHAAHSCSYVRSARTVTERKVRLGAEVVGRMCPKCTTYGSWAREGTGLGIFLRTVTGLGLLYEMGSYNEADEEACSDLQVAQAASLLHRPCSGGPVATTSKEAEDEDEDESAWEELQEARRVRELVFAEWHGALASLIRVHQVLDLFPWLRSWAAAGVRHKEERLEALRSQAEQLVERDALVLAAEVAALDTPTLPCDDPAFSPLGSPAEAAAQLTSLWKRWQSCAKDSWEHPREHDHLVYQLTGTMSSRRKGRAQMLERARILLDQWAEQASHTVAPEGAAEQALLVRLPGGSVPVRGSGTSVLDRLGEWERGILVSYTVGADWQQSTLTVRVPGPVAAQLLSHRGALSYEEPAPVTEDAPGESATPEKTGGLAPGVFDDTPVSARRLVTPKDLAALRSTVRDPEQLYVVLGVEAGVEVVPLSVLEKRCSAGWQGVIIAGASDVPEALFEGRQAPAAVAGTQDTALWASRAFDPCDEGFGRSLSAAEGERVLTLLCEGRREAGQALRSLVLARTVTDLRALDVDECDDRGHPRRSFAADVWNGLLAMEQLDLEPFMADAESVWPSGVPPLPLGVLARVQVYTTDATGKYQGRAHSPGCAHRRPMRGLSCDDDKVSVEELMGHEGFDPCRKCGGYAVRRLTDNQVSYYRATHRLHKLARSTRAAARHGATRAQEMAKSLEELGDLDERTTVAWFLSSAEARRWRRITHGLRRDLSGAL
ncbi:hypothetical protein ABZ454_38445 [Streptomyces sp. NPDC005803]|uniref:hypothetical protein n=1 Tax=Streptomyces sp. NPDC005803 TaxID=3154297 RepID=UPI003407F207